MSNGEKQAAPLAAALPASDAVLVLRTALKAITAEGSVPVPVLRLAYDALEATSELAVTSVLTVATEAIIALKDMVRWFGSYPEFVPSNERMDSVSQSISNAKTVLAGASESPEGNHQPHSWKDCHSALSECSELLGMGEGTLLVDVPKVLAAKLAAVKPLGYISKFEKGILEGGKAIGCTVSSEPCQGRDVALYVAVATQAAQSTEQDAARWVYGRRKAYEHYKYRGDQRGVPVVSWEEFKRNQDEVADEEMTATILARQGGAVRLKNLPEVPTAASSTDGD